MLAGVEMLSSGLENRRHRVLCEPVDLEVGMKPSQFIGDCDVALCVTEADGGRLYNARLRGVAARLSIEQRAWEETAEKPA